MGSSRESDTKLRQRDKSDTFCYRKVERAITLWGAIEKVEILPLQHWENEQFNRCTTFFSFWVHQ